MQLFVAGCLSEDQNRLFRAVGEWLAARRGSSVTESDAATADLIYQCGLPTGEQIDQWRPLVAPVMAAPRYANRPVYWSDVIVRPGLEPASLADLAGTRIAFNERESFSGWVALHFELGRLGINPDLFTWVETGTHLRSLAEVEAGRIDLAAVDSMVLDLAGWEGATVASLGPWPAPPMSLRRSREDRARNLREALEGMHIDPEGRVVLDRFGVARLAPVEAEPYSQLAGLAASVA
jgi:phosphonate transport system substrate-binding protein